EPESVQVYAQPDRLPEVVVQGAPRELELATLQQLEVRWSAADDHQLSQVDLVLRTGGREERRTLERPTHGVRAATGGLVLYSNDEFLERAFLPVVIRVEAKDNHTERGDLWGRSDGIVLKPPSVGAPQVERYAALSGLRDELIDILATHFLLENPSGAATTAATSDALTNDERRDSATEQRARSVAVRDGLIEIRTRLSRLEAKARQVVENNYAGLTTSKGLAAFIVGRLEALTKEFKHIQRNPTPKQLQ